MEAETSDGILAFCLVIRWKLPPTCSKLPCNGHKSDNKVYLLLAHCIVGEEPSNKIWRPTSYIKFSFHCFCSDIGVWAMSKECKFLCTRSNFDRPHILFSLKILLIHHNDQTLANDKTIHHVYVEKIRKIIVGKCPWATFIAKKKYRQTFCTADILSPGDCLITNCCW